MAKTLTMNIYQQNKLLKEQIPSLPFIKSKERKAFMKEVRALVGAAQAAEVSPLMWGNLSGLDQVGSVYNASKSALCNTSPIFIVRQRKVSGSY